MKCISFRANDINGIGLHIEILWSESYASINTDNPVEILIKMASITFDGFVAAKKCYVEGRDFFSFVKNIEKIPAGTYGFHSQCNSVNFEVRENNIINFRMQFMESSESNSGWLCQLQGENIILIDIRIDGKIIAQSQAF